MKKIIGFFVLLFVSSLSFSQERAYCAIQGNVFITNNKAMAHFSFYEDETEGFADMLVFWEDSRVFADQPGLWHLVEAPGLADFILYREFEPGYADFKVFFTDTQSFAGCQHP